MPDIRHDWLCPEVKHRREIPKWLHEAIAQARAAARGDQLPIVVLHQHGAAHAGDLVVMRLSDFCDNFAQNTPFIRRVAFSRGRQKRQCIASGQQMNLAKVEPTSQALGAPLR